jgi:hypothetical protein
MRHAADFAERDHVGNDSGNQKPRFTGNRQQNSRAQNEANQHVNQNCQSKFHYGDYKIFVEVRKQFNKPARALLSIWWGERPREPKVGTPRCGVRSAQRADPTINKRGRAPPPERN